MTLFHGNRTTRKATYREPFLRPVLPFFLLHPSGDTAAAASAAGLPRALSFLGLPIRGDMKPRHHAAGLSMHKSSSSSALGSIASSPYPSSATHATTAPSIYRYPFPTLGVTLCFPYSKPVATDHKGSLPHQTQKLSSLSCLSSHQRLLSRLTVSRARQSPRHLNHRARATVPPQRTKTSRATRSNDDLFCATAVAHC